ncbi:MAG: transcriptional repressor LexA [Ignavibacteriaceae bacterium]|nr:transcriptional repressor LexA [Ignavibacteriaceae bacterium]
MKKQLTERQEEILLFIEQFRTENGYPPTLREIGKRFNISSTFGVKRHLEALVKKGYLNIESNASRGISLIKSDEYLSSKIFQVNERQDNFGKIPIVGRVAAGYPILAAENIEGTVIIDYTFLKRAEDCFALRVKGDSMIGDGIFEGDIVIVNPTAEVSNGEIVVALLEDEATIKRYENKHNQIKLIPANDKYEPILVSDPESFRIVGKVTGVIRWFN